LEEQSAVSRTVSVAGGVYAPGHVGELTQLVDFDLVDAILAEIRAVQQRVRVLPSRVVVYFVLALALFGDCSYRATWAKLTAALTQLPLPKPNVSSLARARRRVGSAPLRRFVRDAGWTSRRAR
jgi:hypothetical protein